ncbi:MAG: chitobiase/beta-hexosaminidase C-terminal domain-containing protein, partial [Kiritimatiellae bacterium]|nr:chitobiase/beta-hexosaminidase C-terminal domain-containing protein [Kiritimatiellia bacterium]
MKPKSRAACSMCMGVRAVVAGALWLGWSVGVWGEVLVARATTWRYRKGTVEASDPRDAWRASDFDDSQWSKGTGAFGYGSGSFGTALPDMQNQYSTLFLRRTFTVTSLPEAVRLRAAVDYDDGFILWINGERVLDKNEPDGEPLYNSLAGGYVGAPGTFSTNEIAEAADCLEIGVNVVVVQVFNSSIGSGDCRFDLELSTFLRVADTKFSHDRGFYTSPFSLTVSTATPGATIRYTTDGRAVTASSTPAPAPYTNLVLSVGATKVLRAAAFKNGYEPTNVDTHTYVFPADVVTQSTMDTRIVNDPRYSGMIVSALEAIPSLCISGDPAKLQSNARIPDSDEYPISLELLHPNPVEEDFAVNCGLSFMTTGQYLTNCWKYKAQYNVYFKAAYGPGKLAYPLFGEDYPLREFNNLRLRAGSNDGWSWWADGIANTQYARDEFGRRTQLETGGVAARGTFVHLYVNGFYRGLYNPCEKPSESFMASHYGGEDEDYDVIKQGYQVVGGDLTAWNAMLNFAANNNLGVDANYETMKGYLDVVRFCDYNLIEIWGPNWDWAPPTRPVSGNNWRAGRKSRNRWPGDPQFTFFVWDYEVTLSMYTNNEYNCSCALTTDISGTYGIGNLHTYLKANPDYVQLFADRAYQWMGDGGVLSTSACVRRYRAITDEIENAVVPESARWGDDHASYVNAPLNRDDYWVPMRNYLLNTFLPQRTGIVLNQLRNRGLYPSLNPPTFHQHGGAIASGFRLTMSNPNGTGQIYYTLDGSDPRV